MRWIFGAAAVAALVGLSATARAGDRPRPAANDRDVVQADVVEDDVVQAGRCCASKRGSCGSRCDSCSPCGDPRIGRLIETLMCGEKMCDRRRAADALSKYNWTQHPEIVTALEYAMQSDPEPRVRWEAADGLKDMKASDPDAIGAMEFTRSADPSCRTRYKAKWGVINGLKARPPVLNYVSGYGEARSANDSHRAPPVLEMPNPERKPDVDPRRRGDADDPDVKPTSGSGVRNFISNAVAKVRSR